MNPNYETISADADLDDADWLKRSWDLPPYKSAEFLELVPPEQLDSFRETPAYRHAVEQGLIHDDEWVADYVDSSPASDAAKPPAKRRHIHIHLNGDL